MKKVVNQFNFNHQHFLQFALLFVLVASLRHVAWGFSTLESNTGACSVLLLFRVEQCNLFWGYFQSIAVDLVIIALAYGIRQRATLGLSAKWYWVGVAGFTFISTYANLLYGLVFSLPVDASRDWPRLAYVLVLAKPFLLSAVLPIMLIYISHITANAKPAQRSDAPKAERKPVLFPALVAKAQALGMLNQWQMENGTKTPRVGWLQAQFEQTVGEPLPHDIADEAIIQWRSENGISGRRPEEAVGVNGRG